MNDWDGETTAHAADGPQWVSAAEAADAAGVTPGTVRYWARNGLIVSEVVPGPGGERTLVRLDEVLQHAGQGGDAGHTGAGAGHGVTGQVVTDLPARTSELAPILKSIPEIMAQLTAATDRAARAETKVEFLSAQLAEMRRRLAEVEAGGSAVEDAVVPPGWDQPHPPAVAAEPDAAEEPPGARGWPAPPAGTLQAAPGYATTAGEPGRESIDWGSGAAGDEPVSAGRDTGSGDVPAPGTERATPGVSLNDIWTGPASRDPAPGDEAPPDVQWREPAGTGDGPSGEAAPPPPPRRANADVPGDDFYGPRRRRWFRRRR